LGRESACEILGRFSDVEELKADVAEVLRSLKRRKS